MHQNISFGAQSLVEFSRNATNILALCHCEKSLISNEGLLVYCIFEKSLVVWWRISNFVRWQNVCCDWRIMNGFGNFRVVRGKSGEHWSRYTNSLYATTVQQTFIYVPLLCSFIFHISMWTWNVCILFRVHDDAIACWIEEASGSLQEISNSIKVSLLIAKNTHFSIWVKRG